MKATASVATVPVTRMVEQTEQVRVVTLKLPPRHAETLLLITAFIGGHPDTTRLGDIDDIRKALEDSDVSLADILRHYDGLRSLLMEGSGSLYFREENVY